MCYYKHRKGGCLEMKKIISMGLILVCIIGMTACGKVKTEKEIDTLADAKSDLYESAEELEEAASVVVKVIRTDKSENVVKTLATGTDMPYGYTKSMVKVTEIMKNTSGQSIEIAEEIQILENQYTYIEDGTKVTCHVNNYKMMEPGNEYILYLEYSESDDWFVILSGLLGKVPVSEEEVLFPSSRITFYKNQPKEDDSYTRNIMEKIRKESLERYE